MSEIVSRQEGTLAVDSKNVFDILKKWLYAEQDIVFREIISNASDAISKLVGLGLLAEGEGRIQVSVDTDKKQIIIRDNGIGMSFDEVEQYINQIAFSGATDFVRRNSAAASDAIIGHFGVGFYSTFMISDHVTIETQSCRAGESAVRWSCTPDMTYQMSRVSPSERGTAVILDLKDDSPYLAKPESVLDIIRKYFIFAPIPIYFECTGSEAVLVNDPDPIWQRPDSAIDTAAMNEFYRSFFGDTSDPLFWIRIESIDIGVRGILFFRDTKNGTEELDGTIKVYSRGVYIGDNIREIIPKFVNLQSGILMCDHLPLVVSRSGLRDEKDQTDMLGLIYESLVQEVTIAMNDLFQNKRQLYEKHWANLNAFVKYAALQDRTFSSVMLRKVIFMNTRGHYQTIQEYSEQTLAAGHPDIIYYASDAVDQAHYIEIFRTCGLNALLFDHVIDQPFMRRYETFKPNLKFVRIDSDILSLIESSPDELDSLDQDLVRRLEEKFRSALGGRLDGMILRVTRLKYDSISTLIINDEQARRAADMMEIFGMVNPADPASKKLPTRITYLVNLNNKIISYLKDSADTALAGIVISQLFDLSLMSQQSLKAEDVESFIERSESVISRMLDHG